MPTTPQSCLQATPKVALRICLIPTYYYPKNVDAVAYLKLRAGASSAPSSTVVEEKCHVGSDDACKE